MSSGTATRQAVIEAVAQGRQAVASYRSWYASTVLLLADSCALLLIFACSVVTWKMLRHDLSPHFYVEQIPVVLVFLAAYACWGLYRIEGMSPIEELRRLVVASSAAFLLLISILFLLKASIQYSRGVTVLAWVGATCIVPVVRLGLRPGLGRLAWFAKPIAILGAGPVGRTVVEALQRNPALALRPIAAFDDDAENSGDLGGVPVCGGLNVAPAYCQEWGVSYAVIAMPRLSREDLGGILRRTSQGFSRLLLMPDLFGISSVWVEARDVGGMLGLEIRNNLLQPMAAAAKRALDLALGCFLLLLILPALCIVALAVKTSPGPVFYSQKRIGKNGATVSVWKFRTMVKDAETVLQQYLAENPHLRSEWMRDHKLKHDPRITRIGRFLRRTSLDELPQLWNVLKGEMSFVGPRPIIAAEVEKFGNSYEYYKRVLPGVTGLWQVSGRNNLSYEERVRLNEYYVRNWSVWLDLYILFKTIRVVLVADGAY